MSPLNYCPWIEVFFPGLRAPPSSHTQHHPGHRHSESLSGTSDNGAFRQAFPDGVGSLFYALLIIATIYKIHDKHKALTEIVFQMVFTCNRIPFVCNSWIYELLHNKMEPPLVPTGGHWLRDLRHATETETYTSLDSIATHLSPWHFPVSQPVNLLEGVEVGLWQVSFSPVNLGISELEGTSGVS